MEIDPTAEVEATMQKLTSAYTAMAEQLKAKEAQLKMLHTQMELLRSHPPRPSSRSGSPSYMHRVYSSSSSSIRESNSPKTPSSPTLSSTPAGRRLLHNTLNERWAHENSASKEQRRHLPWYESWSEVYPEPPIPCNDEERCKVVDDLFVLDSEEEDLYNDLCLVARKMLGVDLVCIDIVARDRIWFKASSINHPKLAGFKTAPRNLAPCNYVVKKGATLVIPDMHSDVAFNLNPLTKLDCSFYAGSPLTTAAGVHVGVFAVLDSRPRLPFGQREEAILELMAATTIKQLEARKASIQVNRMKDQFLANMSHELRTPLHGVIGVMQLLSNTQIDGLQREYVSDAQQSAHVLLHIVNDLLDFAKLNADKIKIELERCNVSGILSSVVRQMQLQGTNREITIDLQTGDIPPDTFALLDSHRIGQILCNLLSNSLKFSPQNSQVTVRAWLSSIRPFEPILMDEHGVQIRMSAPNSQGLLNAASNAVAARGGRDTPAGTSGSGSARASSRSSCGGGSGSDGSASAMQGSYLVFTVEDRGIGIGASLIPRLFDSFAQEDATSSRVFGGSGLGLSIARRLARLMGGNLWLQKSRKGHGTTMLGYVLAAEVDTLNQTGVIYANKLTTALNDEAVAAAAASVPARSASAIGSSSSAAAAARSTPPPVTPAQQASSISLSSSTSTSTTSSSSASSLHVPPTLPASLEDHDDSPGTYPNTQTVELSSSFDPPSGSTSPCPLNQQTSSTTASPRLSVFASGLNRELANNGAITTAIPGCPATAPSSLDSAASHPVLSSSTSSPRLSGSATGGFVTTSSNNWTSMNQVPGSNAGSNLNNNASAVLSPSSSTSSSSSTTNSPRIGSFGGAKAPSSRANAKANVSAVSSLTSVVEPVQEPVVHMDCTPAPVLPAPALVLPPVPVPVTATGSVSGSAQVSAWSSSPAPSSSPSGSPTPSTGSSRTTREKHALSGPALNILVVDDLPLNVKIASRVLEGMGHKVFSALSGMAAIDMVKEMHFDCILMDVQMPEMNGYAATKQIRALEGPAAAARPSGTSNKVARVSATGASPGTDARFSPSKPRMTILAFTASAMPDERQLCINSGMDDVLTKPLDRTLLAERLKEIQEAVASAECSR